MTNPVLSFACSVTDRTSALVDGRVPIPGVPINFTTTADLPDIFRRVLQFGEFDISELSLSSHIAKVGQGDSRYLGIPVFLSRNFRHSAIYIRNDRGISSPKDLEGRAIGISDYQQTAVVWVRGMFRDQYGVDLSKIRWRTGGMSTPSSVQRLKIDLPEWVKIEPLGETQTIDGMLASGELDATIAPMPPPSYGKGSVVRLFPNYKEAELGFYRETRFFPLMHCVVIRRDIVETYPNLPRDLFNAFVEAKRLAYRELEEMGFLSTMLPWGPLSLEEARKELGKNYWSYGVQNNIGELEAILSYAHIDGLTKKKLRPDELFYPSTLDLPDSY